MMTVHEVSKLAGVSIRTAVLEALLVCLLVILFIANS